MKREYTSATLRGVAMITMLMDHIAVCLIQGSSYYQSAAGEHLYDAFRWLGRIAFPLYCFLMVEAFLHTRNRRRYLLTLLGMAVITEPIFDFTIYGGWDFSHQNVLFTLVLGFILLWVFEKVEEYGQRISHYPARVGGVLCGVLLPLAAVCLIAWRLQSDYSYMGILLIAMMYWLRRNSKGERALWCFIMMMSVQGAVSVVVASYLIYYYNGELGKAWVSRWLYRWFYPLHLLLLLLIAQIVQS